MYTVVIFIHNTIMERLTEEMKKELKVLARFVQLFCRAKHGNSLKTGFESPLFAEETPCLCAECTELVRHGVEKRLRCPMEPKPACRKCPVHCYGKEYRKRIREIMAFSGKRMILKGRLDYIGHFLP